MLKNVLQKLTPGAFLNSVAKVVGGNAVTSLISLITSVFVARWTTPYEMGLWNLALLVSIYAPVLQMGVFNGLNRQLPYFLGKGDHDTALSMAAVSYAWCLVLTVASLVMTLLAALLFLLRGETLHSYGALAIGLIVTASWMTQYLTVTYRTSAEFGRLAGRNTVVAFISVPLTLLVLALGYIGLMMRAVLVALLGVASLLYRRPVRVAPVWNRALFLHLCKIGMPIWFLGQLGVFFLTLDRIMLADSPLNLGYFSISIQASAFASMIPIAITMVMYPQMVHAYGESNQAMPAWRLARKGALTASALGAVAALSGWLLIPHFIELLVPAYQPGARAAQWACLSGLAMGFSVYNNIFNVIGRQDIYLLSLAVGLAVFFSAWHLLRAAGQGEIVGAVQSMLLANFIMSIASMLLSRVACVLHDQRVCSAAKPLPAAT